MGHVETSSQETALQAAIPGGHSLGGGAQTLTPGGCQANHMLHEHDDKFNMPQPAEAPRLSETGWQTRQGATGAEGATATHGMQGAGRW